MFCKDVGKEQLFPYIQHSLHYFIHTVRIFLRMKENSVYFPIYNIHYTNFYTQNICRKTVLIFLNKTFVTLTFTLRTHDLYRCRKSALISLYTTFITLISTLGKYILYESKYIQHSLY
jgi:hypothetical protein